MKIIHGHDYYDAGLAYGADPDVVFVREKNRTITGREAAAVPGLAGHFASSVWFLGKHKTINNAYDRPVSLPDGNTAWVKSFRIYVADKNWLGYKIIVDNSHTFCVYSFDALQKWAQDMGYTAQVANSYWFYYRKQVEPLAAGEYQTVSSVRDWMIANQITIMTSEGSGHKDDGWRINGDNLRDYQLYKMIDAYSMWQMISQWVGGILPRNANPMVEITDNKIKAHKHGFDKHSFRKLPEK